ncbi:MAG TPA: hypothetical protein VLJ62_06590 [Burkholderiaceae bacterium]|nr:hypothetical protein [Burkholderiaceae bacterium]
MRVIDCVVAPATGQACWYAHSVRDFDGLVRQDVALARDYPRLRCVAQTMVPTQSLESVLKQCLHDAAPDAGHALVVDVPLTEQEWLTVDDVATLARFRAVVVTPVACPRADGLAPAALRAALSAAGFAARPPGNPRGATVFELDPLAWQQRLAKSRERVASLEAEVRRLRGLWTANERQHREVRQAVARAEGALRALGSILRPGVDDQT